MNTLRAFSLLVLSLFSAIASASSASGIWSSVEGYYLVLMEQSPTGAVVAFAVSPSLQAGLAFIGSHSGDAITLKSLDGTSSVSMIITGSSYTGTYATSSGSLALSGQLLLAYVGSANDGIWQKSDGSARYLSTSTVVSGDAQLMVLLDVTIPASGSTVAYDVSTGVVQSISAYPSFIGKSLVTGNTVSLSFKGGSPATGTYSVMTATRPADIVEQFDVSRIFALD